MIDSAPRFFFDAGRLSGLAARLPKLRASRAVVKRILPPLFLDLWQYFF
jgi:hypothetical protein